MADEMDDLNKRMRAAWSEPTESSSKFVFARNPRVTARWKSLAATHPRDVVAAVRLQRSTGDAAADLAAALWVVGEASARRLDDKVWNALVAAGVMDALCDHVDGSLAESMAAKAAPGKKATVLPCPYGGGPMEAILSAALLFRHPTLSSTDKTVLNVMKRRWPKMMCRLWKDPLTSLKQDEEHSKDRTVTALLLLKLMIADPTITASIFEPDNFTIPLLVRNWIHATEHLDAYYPAYVLSELCIAGTNRPSMRPLQAYLDSVRPSTGQIFPLFELGAAVPTPGAFPAALPKSEAYVTILCAHARQFARLNGRDAAAVLDLVPITWTSGTFILETLETGPAYWRGLYWKTMFGMMRRAVVDDPPDSGGQKIGTLVAMQIITLCSGYTLKLGPPSEALATNWVQADLFEVIDASLERLLPIPGFTKALCLIYQALAARINRGADGLRPVISPKMPRQRTFYTLCRHDLATQTRLGARHAVELQRSMTGPRGTAPDQESPLWDHATWQGLASVWVAARGLDMCARQGCGNAGKSRCSVCKEVMYCGRECQKSDWKTEHKPVCGWMPMILGTLRKGDLESAGGSSGMMQLA